MEVKIKAVLGAELEKYLESVGVLQDIKDGKYICRHCGETITLDNFLLMYQIDGEIALSCDKPSCYLKALNEAKEVQRDS